MGLLSVKEAKLITDWFQEKKYLLFTKPGDYNIIYIEGVNPDFTLNSDRFDVWNDLRIVLDHSASGEPAIIFSAVATTEPGRASTFSEDTRKVGGVARVAFRQYLYKWAMGYHNYAETKTAHPALIQRRDEVIMVHRDVDRNGIRNGDPISPATGINQHSTAPGAAPKLVGKYSAGCLVGLHWNEHIEFINLLKTDNRYLKSPRFAYSTTIIPGDKLLSKKWTS